MQVQASMIASAQEAMDDQASAHGQSDDAKSKKHIACLMCRRKKLKCDGSRPKCGGCTRAKLNCEYSEGYRKAGPRPGYAKTLELRVTQLEKMLADARNSATPPQPQQPLLFQNPRDIAGPTLEDAQSMSSASTTHSSPSFASSSSVSSASTIPSASDLPTGLPLTVRSGLGFGGRPLGMYEPDVAEFADVMVEDVRADDFAEGYTGGYALSGTNMDEALPPIEVINELQHLYFTTHNRTLPVIDRFRYMSRMKQSPMHRPKLFLQYAVLLSAASVSEKYNHLAPVFYQRASKYIARAQSSSQFKDMVNVQFVQATILLGTFEYRSALFPQAWLRVGTTVRASQMLNLHLIDGEDASKSGEINIPKSDSVATDELRRAFWLAFVCDQTASAGTGWPPASRATDVFTRIPLEDHLFMQGKPGYSVPFDVLLENPEILKQYRMSRMAVYIIYSHCQQRIAEMTMGPRSNFDLSPDGWWRKEFARLDRLLTSISFIIEPVAMVAEEERDLVVNLHLMVQTAVLCLNKCALLAVQKSPEEMTPPFDREEILKRCMHSASEITLLIRMSHDVASSSSHPVFIFTIYTSARFFLAVVQSGLREFYRFRSHLDFLITTLRIIRVQMPLAQMFCDSIVAAAGSFYNKNEAASGPARAPHKPADLTEMALNEAVTNCALPVVPDFQISEIGSQNPACAQSFVNKKDTLPVGGARASSIPRDPPNEESSAGSTSSATSVATPGLRTNSMSDDSTVLGGLDMADIGLAEEPIPLGATPGSAPALGQNTPAQQTILNFEDDVFDLDWNSFMSTEALWNDILVSNSKPEMI